MGCTIHSDSPASAPPGTGTGVKSLELSWEKPTRREDSSPLLAKDIEGYLIVMVPHNGEQKFYNHMSTIDPENYQEVPAGHGLYLPPGSIPALAASRSPYAILVSCTGRTEFVIEKVPASYSFAISTISKGGKIGDSKKYSQASKTASIP